MTVEMQHTLEREMEDVRRIEDPARRLDATLTVLVHQNQALVDCQLKTAERVKQLVANAEAKRNRIAGAKALWTALRYFAAMGGTGVLVKALCAAG